MPAAIAAAQSNVRPETIDKPLPTPAGVGFPKTYDIAESKLDDTGLFFGHYDGPSSWDVGAAFMRPLNLSEPRCAVPVSPAPDTDSRKERGRIRQRAACRRDDSTIARARPSSTTPAAAMMPASR